MKQAIVFTSINPPKDGLKRWAAMKDWSLIGVADKKTPLDWTLTDCKFIHTIGQQSALADAIPWNSYSRKMIGYAQAITDGAEVIHDTDDDNYPKPDWSMPPFEAEYQVSSVDCEYFNAYQPFVEKGDDIWPRGFPLKHILATRYSQNNKVSTHKANVGIWQGLADGDPDVDAIYRLLHSHKVVFKKRPPIVLERGVYCPFNSQNTTWRKELFPLMYLPVTVSMRFTDILRAMVAQPIMWEKGGYQLGFTQATVDQYRNAHDNMTDFKDEVPVYLHSERVVQIAQTAVNWKRSIPHNLMAAYLALVEAGIVGKDELYTLKAWLNQFKT